jgi:eukaryotic-like serine/threonine-protein kinase
LNHPNIAHIYGVNDHALSMELVEGESPKGPMAFDDAWKIARQIADAPEFEHEKGIVHRDLKPGNIKATPDGFGLARRVGDPAPIRAKPINSENCPYRRRLSGDCHPLHRAWVHGAVHEATSGL